MKELVGVLMLPFFPLAWLVDRLACSQAGLSVSWHDTFSATWRIWRECFWPPTQS